MRGEVVPVGSRWSATRSARGATVARSPTTTPRRPSDAVRRDHLPPRQRQRRLPRRARTTSTSTTASRRTGSTATATIRAVALRRPPARLASTCAPARLEGAGRRRAAARSRSPPTKLAVTPAEPIAAGREFVVVVDYAGAPAPASQPLGHRRLGGAHRRRHRRLAAERRADLVPVQRRPGRQGHLPDPRSRPSSRTPSSQRRARRAAATRSRPDHVGLRAARADGDLPRRPCRSAATSSCPSTLARRARRARRAARARARAIGHDFGARRRHDGAASPSASARTRSPATRSWSPTTNSRSRSRRRAWRSSARTTPTAAAARSA